MDIRLLLGDCLEVMKTLPDSSVDSVVTDPPAGIAFMGKEWDGHKGGRAEWVAWLAERMAEAHRLAKPGTYALVWALPRTSHWTATAIEDAGWTIRDRVTHLFGTGFPKAKSCLKPGAEDWWLAYKPGGRMSPLQIDACRIGTDEDCSRRPSLVRETPAGMGRGRMMGGNGSPAGRWPANVVLSHDEDCRLVGTKRAKSNGHHPATRNGRSMWAKTGGGLDGNSGPERYMADPDGLEAVDSWECVEGCAVAMLDAMSGTLRSGDRKAGEYGRLGGHGRLNEWSEGPMPEIVGDSGGASRFYYCPKASREDRGDDNDHPTVKNTDLMRWLCRLVTPPGGTILDLFAGTFSTGKAAMLEGFGFLGIERDPHYLDIGRARLDAVRARTPLFAE